MSSKLDFTTMKRWVPDYANRSNTNLWANSTTTTITDFGFVTCVVNSYKVNTNSRTYIYANGKEMAVDAAEARGPNSAVVSGASLVLPVSPGDVISCGMTDGGGYNIKNCYFMPGKWV